MKWKTLSIAPMLVGGLVFGSAFGRADVGRGDLVGFWPAADAVGVKVADRAKTPKAPKAPKAPQAPQAPDADGDDDDATPPPPPSTPGMPGIPDGVSISIHDGKISISGVGALARKQIAAARQHIMRDSNIPAGVRDKVLQRLDRATDKLDKRLGDLKIGDLDQLGKEMDAMGQELAKEMEGLTDDLKDLGHLDLQINGQDLAKKFGKDWLKNFHADDDDADDDDADAATGAIPVPDPTDDDDVRDAVADLSDLALAPAQHDAIAKLGADADRTVTAARGRLEQVSAQLHAALDKPGTSEAQIATYIDQITAEEATIRKARILGWVKARQLLDDNQRHKVEKTHR
ncbi:MAG: hypothetical protein NT062_08860 [Proteobacteria bacterium]|nr:hypothetical protein [Pseudomonadota bacterium]